MYDLSVKPSVTTVQGQIWRTRLMNALLMLGTLGFVAYMARLVVRSGPQPTFIAWIFFLGLIATIFYNPRYGIYLVIALTLVSDGVLIYWYPFVKNFSSYESLFYLHRALIFNPLELCTVLTFVSWFGRSLIGERKLRFFTGPLFWPAAIFISFISIALIYGLLRGGSLNIALWEIRAIYFIPAMLVLTSNLIKTQEQVVTLIWWVVGALFVKSLIAFNFVATTLGFSVGSVDRIAEHALSIHLNSLIVLAIAALLFKARTSRRILLILMLPTVMLSLLANNRRASFIALGIALTLMLLVLYFDNPRLFKLIMPPLIVFGLIYLAVFWNASGPLALPANAVRSVLGEPDERDASSNYYRYLENVNTMFTIKNASLTGVGFGNKFYVIAPMADISFFVFWEYITHNSVLWIWMKGGLGTFVALMFMIGWSVMNGGRAIRLMPNGELRMIAVGATLYIMMHFIFAYVDMSWDVVSMVYVGTMMGLINILPTIAAQPLALSQPRWPWQAQPATSVDR
jgi:hypothetical protein